MPPPQCLTFDVHPAASVTKAMLEEAAKLFSEEYGVWGPLAGEKMGGWCKPGARIKMSAQKLQQQSLKPGTNSALVRCLDNGVPVGHAFATCWDAVEKKVCWVTQLCVRKAYRRRGIATALLKHLKRDNAVFGIMSSHPGALMALLRALGPGLEALDLSFIRTHAQNVLAACPVEYVSSAKLRGAVFTDREGATQEDRIQDEGMKQEEGTVCVADSGFWVDHTEPVAVLACVREEREWPLGKLPEGCEWLVLVEKEQEEEQEAEV